MSTTGDRAQREAPEPPRLSGREKRVRARSLRNLKQAVQESGGQLKPTWIMRDPDQRAFLREPTAGDAPKSEDPKALREAADDEWLYIVERSGVRLDARIGPGWRPPTIAKQKVRAKEDDKATVVPVPERPWSPGWRLSYWSIAFLAVFALLILTLATPADWLFRIAAILGLAYISNRIAVAVTDLSMTPEQVRLARSAAAAERAQGRR